MEKKLLFKLNIQNFAGDGDEETGTPTDEVETENLEDNQEKETDEPKFEDTGKEPKEPKEATKTNTGESKEKLTKEQNRINAERRLQEKYEKDLETERKKAYLNGLKFAIGGENPYTQEKIEDENDLEIYQLQKEMEAKGLDPIEDLPKYIAQKHREEKQAQLKEEQEANKKNEQIQKELAEFDKKYGEGSASKFLTDENFKNSKFAQHLGKLSLSEIYDLYTDTQAKIESEAEKQVIQKEAVAKSSPGRPGNQNTSQKTFMEQLLSDDKAFKEFQRNLVNKF